MHDQPNDDELEELLGAALRRADPVPPSLHQAALDAFAFRDLEAALAELTDSAAAMRDTGASPLVFAADDLEIALEVYEQRCRGQVAPPRAWLGRVEAPHSEPRPFAADELGRFVVDVPPGPIRIVIDGPSGPVRTSWFRP